VKASIAVQPDSFNLITAYNHISAEVKKENVPAKRGIGAVARGEGGGGNPDASILDANGNVKTDPMPGPVWFALDARSKKMVLAASKKNNGSHTNNSRKPFHQKKLEKRIKALQKEKAKYKREISSLKTGGGSSDDDSSGDDDDSVGSNAGGQFGGRSSARAAKDKKKKKAKKN
jgi:hypothetical protein